MDITRENKSTLSEDQILERHLKRLRETEAQEDAENEAKALAQETRADRAHYSKMFFGTMTVGTSTSIAPGAIYYVPGTASTTISSTYTTLGGTITGAAAAELDEWMVKASTSAAGTTTEWIWAEDAGFVPSSPVTEEQHEKLQALMDQGRYPFARWGPPKKAETPLDRIKKKLDLLEGKT